MTTREKRRSRYTEEIVLHKGTAVAQRLIKMGRQKDAQAVLAACVLVGDILATEYGRAPRPDAGLVWHGTEARYVENFRTQDLNADAGFAPVEATVVMPAIADGTVTHIAERIHRETIERVTTHRTAGPPQYLRGPLSPEVLDAEYEEEDE